VITIQQTSDHLDLLPYSRWVIRHGNQPAAIRWVVFDDYQVLRQS